jgi:nucleoside-diphosphate-sugar epimerase
MSNEVEKRTALVVGSTGITGINLAKHLVERGWGVYGLARKPGEMRGVEPVAVDLLDAEAVKRGVSELPVTDVFFSTWLRQETEKENVRVNGAMLENLFAGLAPVRTVKHVALVTGTKHYLGPFEAYGQTSAETPFREENPRLPGENFYYTQEDLLFAAAKEQGFGWSVHRSHTMIGYARGNAMNMGVTLAVYASICKETGQPFVFPGSHLQWNALTDVTDARLLARHLEWAAVTPEAQNEAFNVVNGDVFRWRWMWREIAGYFGVEAQGPPKVVAPLAARMGDAKAVWEGIAAKYGLAEKDVDRLVSWWHTDGDLGRELECVNDMSKSRRLGFLDYQDSRASFFELFEELRAEKLIP